MESCFLLSRCSDVKFIWFWESSLSQQSVFPVSVSRTECGFSGRFQDNYYKAVSLLHRRAGPFPEVGHPLEKFFSHFPSSCLFWSPELGFLSLRQSVPICVQVSLPTSVEFCPQPFQMRLTWKTVPVTWLKSVMFSDHVHHLFCSWGLCSWILRPGFCLWCVPVCKKIRLLLCVSTAILFWQILVLQDITWIQIWALEPGPSQQGLGPVTCPVAVCQLC